MKLTLEQTNSLWDPDSPRFGLQIISARAGTGKTTLITEYCITVADNWLDTFKPWQGMAMISYTNVAKDEIKAKLQKSRGNTSLVNHPHSIETIDSFLNKKLFLLHGGELMGFPNGRPKLVGEPFSSFKAKDSTIINKFNGISNLDYGFIFDKTYYGIDGRIYPNFGNVKHGDKGKMTVAIHKGDQAASIPWFNNGGVESKYVQELRAYKEAKHKEGLVSQADANYFAYKALTSSDHLTKSIIKRFPIFIIDEAQDMTEVQHAILDHLIDNGLKNVVMIGDEQQAIYEWNTARPELFTKKVADDNWLDHEIAGTFRNSQSICNALNSHTITGSIKPAEGSKNLNYTDHVEIVNWSIKEKDAGLRLKAIVDDFAQHLSTKDPHNEDELRLAILARSKEDAAQYRAFCIESPDLKVEPVEFNYPHSREILKVAYYLINGDRYNAFKTYERMLYKLSDAQSIETMKTELLSRLGLDEAHRYNYRRTLYTDLLTIESQLSGEEPTISQLSKIDEWRLEALSDDVANEIKSDYPITAANDQPIANMLVIQNEKPVDYHPVNKNVRLVFSTIHGVKGETYDGILYALREKTLACGCPKHLTSLNLKIAGHDMLECENKRIQYVAMSRAAQSLWVAVASDCQKWQTLLSGVLRQIDVHSRDSSSDRVLSQDEWKPIWQGVIATDQVLGNVLRMSSARIESRTLIVSFKFMFHKKRFGNAQQEQAIKAVADKVLGVPLKISIIHEPEIT